MGSLCILGCICTGSFFLDSQGCRFPFHHRERFPIHSYSISIRNKNTIRALCITNDSSPFLKQQKGYPTHKQEQRKEQWFDAKEISLLFVY